MPDTAISAARLRADESGSGGFAPDARTMPDLVRELSERLPHRPAVITDEQTVTFAEFEEQSSAVAAALLACGVGRGDAVAIWIPNQPEWLACMAGAARIGAMAVPLNTWFKDDEAHYVLEHSEAKVLIAADQVRGQDLHASVGRICRAVTEASNGALRDAALPQLRHVIQLGPRRHPGARSWSVFLSAGGDRAAVNRAGDRVEETDPLYLLYTSGTTAEPKAVPLTHGHCIANGHALGVRQGMGPDDRSWLVQPLFWALGAMNMLFSTWTHGAAVILQRVFDAGTGLQTIERHRATHTFAVGNISSALLAHPQCKETDLSSLVKGVSLFSHADRVAAYEGLGMTDFVSVYGSTETHGSCFCASHTDSIDLRMADNGPIMPAWEARLVIPGTDEQVADPSQPAELTVRGRLAPGYWKAPEQTSKAFDAEGWFHTGDVVRVTPEGRLVFVSRQSEMIKTGGINVAPAEVESVLMRHPAVGQAHVVGVPHPTKGEQVVAVVNDTRTDGEELRAWMAERVAAYKVPARVLCVSDTAIPRLATGKIAKRKLRGQVAAELGIATGVTDP